MKKSTTVVAIKEEYTEYTEGVKHNEALFNTLLERLRPDLYVLSDLIDKNNLNVYVILKFLYQLLKVASFDGWGSVHVIIQKGKVTRIEGIDSTLVNESIYNEKQT